jgi:transcriptional regulator with XRE-family HTH domain
MIDGADGFIDELRRWRDVRGLSQSRLAQEMKYDRSYISKVETGQEWPAPDFARRADDALQAGGALLYAYRQSQAKIDTSVAVQRNGRFDGAQLSGTREPGIAKFYSDFVDIEGDWDALFAVSSTLDLAIMYGATWRNTHRKRLQTLAERPDGRVRLVLPDPSSNSPMVGCYAHMLGTSPEDFRHKITEAIDDFQSVGPRRHIEIYLTESVFRHAIYLFAHQAVLALYALCGERISTPAFLASDGELLSFVRLDFDRLLNRSNRIA